MAPIYVDNKELLRVKPQTEVLAFRAYMLESLLSLYNSLIKVHSKFMCQTYSQYVKTAEPLAELSFFPIFIQFTHISNL